MCLSSEFSVLNLIFFLHGEMLTFSDENKINVLKKTEIERTNTDLYTCSFLAKGYLNEFHSK